MLSSSRRPSIKVEWYSYYIRHPVTPPLPYTRNLLLAPFLLAMSLHQTANQDDYSCSNNGASYANPGNGRPAELLLFPHDRGPRSGGGLWRIVLLRGRGQIFPFHIGGVDARELEVEAFLLHVGDVCAGEMGPEHGSLVVGVKAQLEGGIGSSVHALRGVVDLETGPTNAVVGDAPLQKRREVGGRLGIFFLHQVGFAQWCVSVEYGKSAAGTCRINTYPNCTRLSPPDSASHILREMPDIHCLLTVRTKPLDCRTGVVMVKGTRTYARGTCSAVLEVTFRKAECCQKCGSILSAGAMQMRLAPGNAVHSSCTPETGIPPRERVKKTCGRIVVFDGSVM